MGASPHRGSPTAAHQLWLIHGGSPWGLHPRRLVGDSTITMADAKDRAQPGAAASSRNLTASTSPTTSTPPTYNASPSSGDNTTTSRQFTLGSGGKEDDVKMDLLRNSVDNMRPQRLAVYVYSVLAGLAVIAGLGVCLLPWPYIATIGSMLAGFIVFRHITIKRSSPPASSGRRWMSQASSAGPTTDHLPAVYFLYVLGSGGHTSEMLETVKRHFSPQPNLHRRYLVTLGDHDSLRRLCELEDLIHRSVPDVRSQGTWDVVWVPRARRVHQPLWTAPLTCLQAAVWTVAALALTPDLRRTPPSRHRRSGGGSSQETDDQDDPFRYPHVVVTNGPGTGFIVALVARLLKLLCLAPRDRLRTVYVESWARTRTLSLTGRLFLRTGLADVFGVQHRGLERRYGASGAVYVGNLGRPLAPPTSTSPSSSSSSSGVEG
ncbi:hypothetical protein VTJ83DRAFT_6385 [Remersonia thermophila]|uniref:UDP-N-acetylglucosamine transferase subunit ALG14 n=1 Tax=Remersonia thermophila TaxID=72144 RepID=A0ABR4D4I9_9PEZI